MARNPQIKAQVELWWSKRQASGTNKLMKDLA